MVVGGGCSLLRLSKKVDTIKELLDNEEQKEPPCHSIFNHFVLDSCCSTCFYQVFIAIVVVYLCLRRLERRSSREL